MHALLDCTAPAIALLNGRVSGFAKVPCSEIVVVVPDRVTSTAGRPDRPETGWYGARTIIVRC